MKSIILIAAPFVVILAILVGSFVWWNSAVSAPSTNSAQKRILITKGDSASVIGQNLEKEGVVKSGFAFKLYTQVNSLTKRIPPGEFTVPMNLNLEDVVKLLLKGPTEIWITIPEGYRREEIAQKFVDSFELKGADATTFKNSFLASSGNMEGYLFPDTYLFPKDVEASVAVNKLRDTFDQKTKSLDTTQSKLSFSDAIILASIIERETITQEERPVVAGILINRLDLGIPLQADATVQYAIGSRECLGKSNCDWWRPPTKEDLKLNSPFNTYLNPGLPPAPIANPGISSIEAALSPQRSDYLYYIHDADGKIHYAKTLEEHNANVAKYLH